MSHDFSLALGFDREPSAASLLSAEGWFVQVNYCVLAACLWSSHIFSWGKRNSGDLSVVTQSIFSYLCMLHGHIFILSYKDMRNLLAAWDLIRRTLRFFSWWPFVSGLQPLHTVPTYTAGAILGHILFFVLSFKKTLQLNMYKRSTPMIFTEPVGQQQHLPLNLVGTTCIDTHFEHYKLEV